MKKLAVILLMVGIVSLAQTARTAEFTVSSPQLPANGRMAEAQVYNSFGCTGKNISPILMWQNAPEKTRSFAVTVYDPDAPTGSGWWHWLIFNIPTKVNMLPENAGNKEAGLAPAGSTQSRTDYGTPGYGGACPPAGDQPHRYIFTVFALDVDTLPLPENASAAMVGFNLNQHAIAKAQMTVHYSR
ncbi:MAG: YbhB/YbcL family Raf kinase inhibitor-like protein [Deltaproteobacteria bacterium CG23_combo_of_CG06-09_8_20_14_all_60_8]|nr:MAG: phosphatidylethanolamine-binding protein [Desulfobacterales bacterium CG2_30_60_27]PIP43858.1 MAG: YbhB/YbcL family Raf kinase inhibitor-like protein [Deltaproteobacteria bacterium CG23_combo_of_CG06-09_8_20_14_all_60_8]